jgi:hypothetical protein
LFSSKACLISEEQEGFSLDVVRRALRIIKLLVTDHWGLLAMSNALWRIESGNLVADAVLVENITSLME